ncbi:conserved Plasmodium protein, unknown function [Plasmodium reichenowi]|uniref:Protein phosphatase 1 regulatory subunit 21 N-terminal domain-containing protein n=1 Tax=Plasmodium reichenowi TaxID=5854 RepID=A0A060RNX1_PLARE|nr:conserved Plasmodium protein, unknown function [Plasmodium reichenowi]
MNVEDKYKLIKEKYKEIKEQNDILKKAIIEYKKDLKELEKKNDILSNEKNQLQKNLTLLSTSLEEQKKKNSGWTNLMLLTKNSRENIHKSVAFEELEMKIKENETLHKNIEDLHQEKSYLKKELELLKKDHIEKINEKELTIGTLNDLVNSSHEKQIKADEQYEELKKLIEENQKEYSQQIKKKDESLDYIRNISTMLHNKCYPKYMINFDQIPFYQAYDTKGSYIQKEILQNEERLANYLFSLIQKVVVYLKVCKELFLFQTNNLDSMYNKMKKEKLEEQDKYSKMIDLKNICDQKVKILEEIIDTAEKFKIYDTEKEDKELMENIFHIIKNKIRELFVKVNVYLCIEEYMFPSFINNKVFVLRNVIQQFRLLKELVIKIINIITLIISICPYNNERIILENLRKRNIIKKENNKIINRMEKRNEEEKYTNISSFDMIHITNICDDDKLFVYNKQYENKSLYNNFSIVEKKRPFINFLQEKEKIILSQFNDFKNYQTKNNHIILFILKKIQRILQYIPQSLKFLKSYISYRLCEINRFGNFYINNSPLITNLLDKTNEFIKSIENFNYIHIHNIIYTKLSYINYHTPYLYKQHITYINNINQTFNKAKVHTYDKLQKNLKDLQNFKKDNIQLNMKLLKSKKENKKLKIVNQETLNNIRNILLENQELSLNNQYLINSIDNKREDKQYSNDNNNIQTYAEKIYNFISHTDEGKKNFNIKEKQLIEAYISSCIKINNLNMEIQNNKHILEELQNLFNIKENEIKNLNTQIDTYKEEEVNIHKKYEEQMNTLHDLIVSLEKQITKINSEKNVNKFFIMCSICSNKNNIGAILKNRKCIKCNSFIIFMNE